MISILSGLEAPVEIPAWLSPAGRQAAGIGRELQRIALRLRV